MNATRTVKDQPNLDEAVDGECVTVILLLLLEIPEEETIGNTALAKGYGNELAHPETNPTNGEKSPKDSR